MLLCVAIFAAACQQNNPTTVSEVVGNIVYFRDSTKKDSCFAAVNSNSYGGFDIVSITTVDCDKAFPQ